MANANICNRRKSTRSIHAINGIGIANTCIVAGNEEEEEEVATQTEDKEGGEGVQRKQESGKKSEGRKKVNKGRKQAHTEAGGLRSDVNISRLGNRCLPRSRRGVNGASRML